MTTQEIVFQIAIIIVTLLGVLVIVWQIYAAQKVAKMSSILSTVAEHWMLIEERRMQIRSGDMIVSYPRLLPHLKEILSARYNGNLDALAADFLQGDQTEVIPKGEGEILEAVMREYARYDLYFNLCEEEYVAAKYLNVVNGKLWRYWDSYIRENFRSTVIQNHWQLRRVIGLTFPDFVEFVEQNYLANQKVA